MSWEPEDIIDQVQSECDVYPKPSRDDILEEAVLIHKLSEANSEETLIPRATAIESLARALDTRQRMQTDEWISYDGPTVDAIQQ